ncbi:MAG: hypothetical protein MUE97_04180, partial [Phycisphaerales bacterium]|nr:hypothetical protein [Phycisphaerales bacterium]
GDDIGIGADDEGRGGMPTMLRSVSKAFDELAVGSHTGWVRLMYAYPSNFSVSMMKAIASTPRVLRYIDMPLQHASDAMLSAMRRHITADATKRLLDNLRTHVPGIALRTTFISGFPGETEADHEALMRFVEEQRFENLGVFEYSQEPGTVAGTMEADPKLAVPAETKARRRNEIMELQQSIAFARQKALADQFDEHRPASTGVRMDVLIDSAMRSQGRATSGVGSGGRLYSGRTFAQAPQIDSVTYVQSRRELSPGELIRCTIVGSDGYDLVAKPVEELERRVSLNVMK